jgi:transposase
MIGGRSNRLDNLAKERSMNINKRYTKQFKEEAMKLVSSGQYDPTGAARELGMPPSTLKKWLEIAGWRAPDKSLNRPVLPLSQESDDPLVLKVRLKELEEENRRLRLEKEILKKATAFFAGEQS